MNIYLLVEGSVGEKLVYGHWIPMLNNSLRVVNSIDDVDGNSVYIISGNGYPSILEMIEDGVEDIRSSGLFDRFVVAVDSEENTYEEKKQEFDDYMKPLCQGIDYRIVIQHYCLETWAIGNKSIIRRNPECKYVREYRRHYDVLTDDPEYMPAYEKEGLNRAKFTAKYLKKILNDKFSRLTYKKSDPSVLLHPKYFDNVVKRHREDSHLSSFGDFLNAFV